MPGFAIMNKFYRSFTFLLDTKEAGFRARYNL